MDHGPAERTDAQRSASTVVLDVPAEARSLRLLRLAASDAAAIAGLDLDRIEVARLVVDELASTLIAMAAADARLTVRITRDAEVLLEGDVQVDSSGSPEVDFIVRELLNASVGADSWSLGQDRDTVWFRAAVAPPAGA